MPEKEKKPKRLTSSLHLCAVEILRELKSVHNSSVVLAEVCGCTILPVVFCSDGLDELRVNVVNVKFPLCDVSSEFVVI
jgi:hypothetical protein